MIAPVSLISGAPRAPYDITPAQLSGAGRGSGHDGWAERLTTVPDRSCTILCSGPATRVSCRSRVGVRRPLNGKNVMRDGTVPFKNYLNPMADELRAWAADPGAVEPTEDWEVLLP